MSEPKVPRWCRTDWNLFAAWCAAFDLSYLPARPFTLARFLDANPAADATQLHRIGAINTVHRANKQIPPGRAQAIRDLYSAATRDVFDPVGRRSQAETAILRLPSAGWPGGLFGRRDALLLVLACYAELPLVDVSALQRSQVSYTHHTVVIGAGHDIGLTRGEDPRTCPVAIYLRWARLQAYHDRLGGNWRLARALTNATPVTADSPAMLDPLPSLDPRHDGPLIPGFDQWGHHAARRLDRRGINPRALGRIVAAHLSGPALVRPTGKPLPGERITQQPNRSEPRQQPPSVSPDLSPDEIEQRYQAFIERRTRGMAYLEEITGGPRFAALDADTDALLKRTEALLNQLTSEST